MPTKAKSVSTKKKSATEPSVLFLTLHRQFFDEILSGKKKTEYREDKPYWRSRLLNRDYTEVHFRNGYAPDAPFMRVVFKGIEKTGKGRSSTFGIKLGKILETKHLKSS